MGKKPSVGRPKGKNVLAKALSGQQQKQLQKEQLARAEQAAQDRANAAKSKIVQQKSNSAKKRKLASTLNPDKDAPGAEEQREGEDDDVRQQRAIERRKAFAQPFRRGERVLLVGEGNFSFAHSLLIPNSTPTLSAATNPDAARRPVVPVVTPTLLLCTSYDSYDVAREKYPDLDSHVQPLRDAGATVLFDVDATKLESNKLVMEFCGKTTKGRNNKGKARADDGAPWEPLETSTGFDKIVFNFPHVGQGITDQDRNIRTNQTLLLDFYLSASHLLRNGTSQVDSASTKKKARGRDDSRSPTPPPPVADFVIDNDDAATTTASPQPLVFEPGPPTTRGTILVTLRTQGPYAQWLPAHLATKPLLLLPSILPATSLQKKHVVGGPGGGVAPRVKAQPTYKTVKSWEFEPSDWNGYEHRRTIGWDDKKSFVGNDDIRLTAKERKRLGDETAVNTRLNQQQRDSNARPGSSDKGSTSTGMRTWEFELVVKEYDGPARDGGWGGKTVGAKRKRGGGKDSDRDDDDSD